MQGSHNAASYGDLGKRYDIEPDLSDANLQRRLEEVREGLKREIRKELKIKEGAENLRKVTTDKKSLDNVNKMVKQANSKLEELHQELQELNAHLLVATNSNNKLPGKWHSESSPVWLWFMLGGVSRIESRRPPLCAASNQNHVFVSRDITFRFAKTRPGPKKEVLVLLNESTREKGFR